MIESLPGLFIKEKADWLGAISGCESNNAYSISPIIDTKGPILFKAREDSGCCTKNCMAPNLRPFHMFIRNEYNSEMAIQIERDYSFPIFCLFRPQLRVYDMVKGMKNQQIGHIVDTYDLCTIMFDVYDHNNSWIYRVSTEWC